MNPLDEQGQKELKIYTALKNVMDPELGVNIIDLGLVYKVEYKDNNSIYVEMTLSSRACPMGDIIVEDVKDAVSSVFPTIKADVVLVWKPVWNASFITEAGKKELEKNF